MTSGLATPCVMPPKPDPTTNATSGLNPASFASKNSFVSFTFAIIRINPSLNLLHDQRGPRCDAFVINLVCLLHHVFSLVGTPIIILMHDHQGFACRHGITDLFWMFETDRKINLIR